jgi:hypothetical protein
VVTEDLKENGDKGNSTSEVGDYLVSKILE